MSFHDKQLRTQLSSHEMQMYQPTSRSTFFVDRYMANDRIHKLNSPTFLTILSRLSSSEIG